MNRVYLSRRNLLSLLNKLDRKKEGGATACTIIKNDNEHPVYPQTMASIEVIAIEDDDYYSHREAGMVHPADDPYSTPEARAEFLKRFERNVEQRNKEVEKVLNPMCAWPFPTEK